MHLNNNYPGLFNDILVNFENNVLLSLGILEAFVAKRGNLGQA